VVLAGAGLVVALFLLDRDRGPARVSRSRDEPAATLNRREPPVAVRKHVPPDRRRTPRPLVDSEGRVIRDAVIQVREGGRWIDAGRIDGNGRLHWDREPEGAYEWRVLHPTLQALPLWREADGGGARVDARVVVVLSRGGTVSGRVLDDRGRGVPGATVTADGQRTESGDDGRYSLVVGEQGAIIRARKDGVGMGESGVISARMSMPEAVTVEPGEKRPGVDIRLFPVSRVTGRVVGLPWPAGVSVEYEVRKPGLFRRATVEAAADGSFSTEPFFVPVESEVALRVGGGPFTMVERTVSVVPGGSVDAGGFRLGVQGAVAGRVLDAAGDPVPGGVVQMANVRARVGEDGAFTLLGVPEGRWSAAFYHWDEPSRAAALGAVVDVAAGGALEGYEIRVEARGVLLGRAFDASGTPLADVQVAVAPVGIPENVDSRKWGAFRTNDEGRFSAGKLAAGRYAIAVVRLGSGILQEFPMDELMTPVEIDVRGGENAVELRMPAVGMIRARIEGAGPHANVTIHWLEHVPRKGERRLWLSRRSLGWTAVAEDFEEPVPESGHAVVSVRREKHATWVSEPMQLHPRESVELGTIRLGAGRTIRLAVRNPDGSAPAKVAARVVPHPGPEIYGLGLAGADYRDGALEIRHAPERGLAVVVSGDRGAAAVVLVPASGSFEQEVRLSAPVSATVRGEAPKDEFLWVLDRATGHLVHVAMLPHRGELTLGHLPPRPLTFVLGNGLVREFEPLPGGENVVSFR